MEEDNHKHAQLSHKSLGKQKQWLRTILFTYLAVNDSLGQIKLADHAKWDGATAWLCVVKLALEQDSVDPLLLGEDLGGACTSGSSSDDGNLVLHAQST